MRYLLTILLTYLSGCLLSLAQTPQQVFLNELGPKKAQSFNLLLDSFHKYLAINYPNAETLGEQTKSFLSEILKEAEKGKYLSLVFDSVQATQLIAKLENSGLRKDIFLTSSEVADYQKYDVEQFISQDTIKSVDLGEIDDDFEDILPLQELTEKQKRLNEAREKKLHESFERRPNFNGNGLFIFALAKSMQWNTSFHNYIKLKKWGVEPTPSNLAKGYLANFSNSEMELWYNQIPLIIDIYYFDLLHKYVVNQK